MYSFSISGLLGSAASFFFSSAISACDLVKSSIFCFIWSGWLISDAASPSAMYDISERCVMVATRLAGTIWPS